MSHSPGFKVLGLTGGIASGKSTVARIFEELGAPVVDADAVSRELSAPGGKAHDAILQRFGTADRMELRQKVFADPGARKDLEAILHPLIATESRLRMTEAATRSTLTPPIVVYEAALLVETGRYRDFDGLVVVEAPAELRRERLMQRDKISRELADQILSAQISDEQRQQVSTDCIQNTGNLQSLRSQVQALLGRHQR